MNITAHNYTPIRKNELKYNQLVECGWYLVEMEESDISANR